MKRFVKVDRLDFIACCWRKNVGCGSIDAPTACIYLQIERKYTATCMVKSPWDTRFKSLTQLPVVSYCYQIIVLSTHSLTPSPLSPQINVELNMYEDFFTNYNIERGEGGWTTFLQCPNNFVQDCRLKRLLIKNNWSSLFNLSFSGFSFLSTFDLINAIPFSS